MPRTLAAALLATVLLLPAGCADDARPETREQQPRRLAEAEPSTRSTAPAEPSGSATPHERPGRRVKVPASEPPAPSTNALTVESVPPVRRHLLDGSQLGEKWSVASTGTEDGRLMSSCQVASMVDIGALRSRVREFSGPDARAGQALSRFADRKSAWRAEQVLAAWRDDCSEQLADRRAALGTVRHRTWLSVVEVEGGNRPERRLRRALRQVKESFTA